LVPALTSAIQGGEGCVGGRLLLSCASSLLHLHSMAASSSAAAKPEGHVRCKNFGCNKYFDPTKPELACCIHHKAPPVFHECAKYWSCCPTSKVYDWDELFRIPGCMRGHCSDVDPKKKFLGGTDLRAENAPKRLDDEIPVDPRKKLDRLRAGLAGLGVDEGAFDKAWGRLAAKNGDLNLVCSELRQRFTEALEELDDVNTPD